MKTTRGKEINRTNISPIISPRRSTHTTTSPPFPQKTREIHDSCLFSPVNSSTITTSGISKSQKVRFLTAWSSFSCFTVYQPAAKNSIQYSALQIPWNLELTLRLHLLEWYRHCPGCLRTLFGIFGGISRNTCQHSPKYVRKFPGTFGDIPRNVWRHSSECLAAFPGMFEHIPGNITFPTFLAFPAFRSPFLYSWFYT